MSLITKVIVSFVTALISFIAYPIDLTLQLYLPNVNNALLSVTSMLNWLVPFANWVLSWLPFSTNFYTFLISVLIFNYSIPLLFNAVKVVVKWWHALVP